MSVRSGVARWGWLGVVALATLGAALGWWMWSNRPVPGIADMEEALRGRGRIALVGGGELRRLGAPGVELVRAAKLSAVERGLHRGDADALLAALDDAGVEGLLVEARPGTDAGVDGTVARRLRRFAHVHGLAGHYLAPAAVLYLRQAPVRAPPPLDQALAQVARGILEGKRPPRIKSFPEPLRRLRNVEIMVMLRDGSRPRLWRSARGSSIARALVTASSVARERWQEREQAMGGPLATMLSKLTVEVSLLVEDGTLGAHDPAFLDRAITSDHGVGYERKGSWRYLLPERTGPSGAAAFERLFRDNGLELEAMDRPDVRLYRLVVNPLASSSPTVASDR